MNTLPWFGIKSYHEKSLKKWCVFRLNPALRWPNTVLARAFTDAN